MRTPAGSCGAWWVVCGSLSFNRKMIWLSCRGVPRRCVPARMPACFLTALYLCLPACACVCSRWNNEVDYESPGGVMRRNRSITRYV